MQEDFSSIPRLIVQNQVFIEEITIVDFIF